MALLDESGTSDGDRVTIDVKQDFTEFVAEVEPCLRVALMASYGVEHLQSKRVGAFTRL